MANFRKPDDANGPSRIPACLILPDQGRIADPANEHDDQVATLKPGTAVFGVDMPGDPRGVGLHDRAIYDVPDLQQRYPLRVMPSGADDAICDGCDTRQVAQLI
jgi:hypothetical protein